MRRKPYTDITVAELTRRGMEAVEASCLSCGADWRTLIGFLPPATTLAKVASLLVCPECGYRDVEIREPIGLERRLVQ